MDWITTSSLLSGLKDFENADAWHRFVTRFRAPVAAFARGMGNSPADAEDIAQDALLAFATAYRNGAYSPDKGRLSSWLFGIARNHALRSHRKRERSPVLAAQPDDAVAPGIWERCWNAFVLDECLRRARAEHSDATFRLFERVVLWDEEPAAAAAAEGVDLKAVYNAKHRVLSRMRSLRDELERVEDPA